MPGGAPGGSTAVPTAEMVMGDELISGADGGGVASAGSVGATGPGPDGPGAAEGRAVGLNSETLSMT